MILEPQFQRAAGVKPMETLFHYTAPPTTCGYLPDEMWSLEYEIVAEMSADEYLLLLQDGWRRFGTTIFQPQCPTCRQCQSLRVVVDRFRPNRSQKRAVKTNADVELRIGVPDVSREKLRLYDRYHNFQSDLKGWPNHPAKDADSYRQSFVDNPIATEEWCYYLNGCLIGVGYIDALAEGASAIYFFYDPQYRSRSLGVYNVMCVIDESKRRNLPYVYLGYYVSDCASLNYKARFQPNEIRGIDGTWRTYRE